MVMEEVEGSIHTEARKRQFSKRKILQTYLTKQLSTKRIRKTGS